MTAKRRLGTTGYYVVSILIAVVAMIPFLWMISTSLKSRGALMSIPIEWIPAEPSLDAYGEVFSRFPFLKTIGNSLFISVSYTVITLISASMAAFAFAKIRFRCANLLLKLYLATMMIPTQVTMIPLFVIMNRLGLIDSYASVILPSTLAPLQFSCWFSRCVPYRWTIWTPHGWMGQTFSRSIPGWPCRCARRPWQRWR